jgi:hypothetical protein
MIEASMSPLRLEKHIPPKRAYRKYKIWSTNMKPPKTQLPRKTDGAQSSIEKGQYH